MLVVRATQKLRDRVKRSPPRERDASTTALGDWFATALFWRPHVALLVNQRTFLPVYLELAPATTLLDRVPDAIAEILEAHGVGDDFMAAEREAMRDVRIGPTNDRSVVGVMNEFAYHGKYRWQEGFHDFRALSLLMAGMPLGPLRDRSGFPDKELELVVGGDASSARIIQFPGRGIEDADAPAPESSGSVYQLKVTLLDTQPPIWRRVLVDGGNTLGQLHEVIQAAFGWWNSHLHEFHDGHTQYGHPYPDADWEPEHDERRTRLDTIAKEGSTLDYTYDFGDSWEHEIVVEKVLPGSADIKVPACVDGRRACPPEDCGGTGGYEQLLAILADRNHPERADYLEWLDGPFDPEAFDPSDFAANLREVRLGRIR